MNSSFLIFALAAVAIYVCTVNAAVIPDVQTLNVTNSTVAELETTPAVNQSVTSEVTDVENIANATEAPTSSQAPSTTIPTTAAPLSACVDNYGNLINVVLGSGCRNFIIGTVGPSQNCAANLLFDVEKCQCNFPQFVYCQI